MDRPNLVILCNSESGERHISQVNVPHDLMREEEKGRKDEKKGRRRGRGDGRGQRGQRGEERGRGEKDVPQQHTPSHTGAIETGGHARLPRN